MLMPLLAAAANTVTTAMEEQQQVVNTMLQGRKSIFSREVLLVLLAMAAVSLAIFLWAAFIRKRPKEARNSRVLAEPNRKSARYGSSGRRRHRKRRLSHPDNLGRNPTLAETGGLPPPRADETPPPAAGQASPGFIPPV